MLRPICRLFVCFGLLASSAFGGVDLTPSYHRIDLGGTSIERVYFRDGNKQYAVTINPEIEITKAAGGAVFRFKSFPLADMSLRPSSFTPEIPFSTEKLPDYRRAARELLGPMAEVVEQSEPEFDVLPINEWKSCRFNFTFKQAGLVLKADVTFLNLSKSQQIVIVTSAKEAEFTDVQGRAHKIMSRWHLVQPGDELGVN